jgi:protein-disulfide isomerase
MMKSITDLFTAAVCICAVIMTGIVVQREFFATARVPPLPVKRVADWEVVAASGTMLGSADAPLRIVLFSDFQCPYCADIRPELDQLRRAYPGQVALIYRHFPLQSIHPHALTAALAAECAAAQGRFEAFHDLLFQRQDSIGVTGWEQFAISAALPDLPEFGRCLSERRYESRIRRDMAEGERIGIDGTPALLFDGRLIAGTGAVREASIWVEEALRSRRK